jgi:hypothetical protein
MNIHAARLGTQQIVEAGWRDQATWSETANRLKADLDNWRLRAAVAGVVGAFCETLAASLGGLSEATSSTRAIVALIGAVILAIVPYVSKTKASREQVLQWVRARSASEALKEETYRFLVGGPPYGPQRDPTRFIDQRQKIKDKVQDLNGLAAAVDPPKKQRPLELTIDGYVDQRVNAQIDGYYLPKGKLNAERARRLRNLEFGLGLLAVIMGALASAAPSTGLPWLAGLGSWVAVVTTAGAAVTAHLASARYDHAAITYFGTANRLNGLRDAWLADPHRSEQERVNKFVDDAESAISSENEAWLADWTRDK